MPKSIFISYVYEDKEHRDKLKTWASKKLLGDNCHVTYERKDCRQKGKAAIEAELEAMIQGAGAVLVLLGQNTHNHPWVLHEIDLAKKKNKKMLLVRINGTTGGKPKPLSEHSEILFDVNKIKIALDKK
jgi:hypothetical protein